MFSFIFGLKKSPLSDLVGNPDGSPEKEETFHLGGLPLTMKVCPIFCFGVRKGLKIWGIKLILELKVKVFYFCAPYLQLLLGSLLAFDDYFDEYFCMIIMTTT